MSNVQKSESSGSLPQRITLTDIRIVPGCSVGAGFGLTPPASTLRFETQ
ncbi:MAG: hypothetical protein ABI782_08920 [Anaerolineaceae bacterium]